MSHGLRFADADLIDPQLVAGQYFNADAIAFHRFAHGGDMAEPLSYQPADGGGFDVLFAVERLDEIAHARQIEIAGNNEAAHPVFGHIAVRFVLVADLTYEDFQQILHRGQAGGVAVFIHDDHHVSIFLLHLAHQIVHRLAFGHEQDWAQKLPHDAPLALLFFEFEHITDVNETHNLIDVLLVRGDAGVLHVDNKLA